MSDIAIKTSGLYKLYRIGAPAKYPTIREALARAASAPLRAVRSLASARNNGDDPHLIWALRDVDFEVKQGEVVGIIGRNGAGKSTLLKILSGITEPTAGYTDIYGRVGSLLEVGTGFHMELTGRENIFMNGALLGMSRSEIRCKFDKIVDFAEIEKFLDTPVKRYSSGMYMRLAFAVAAHLEPEILMVDEVLAVGDAAFQKKCLGKIGEVAKDGRTVLFVSHNLFAIETLCNRAIWFEAGRIAEQGDPRHIIPRYLRESLQLSTERVWMGSGMETEGVRLHRVRVRPSCGAASDPITVHSAFLLQFEYWNLDPAAHLSVSFRLYNEKGLLLFDISSPFDAEWRQNPSPKGLLCSVCNFPGDFLNDGLYRIGLIILRNQVPVIHEPEAFAFHIQDGSIDQRDGWYGKWPGLIRPMLRWETNVAISSLNGSLSPRKVTSQAAS
jgi:lipopolysaccharide transport system ATP-binding protein